MAEQSDRQGGERSSRDGVGRFLPSVQVIGWAFLLLILAGYFAWMIIEMGAHAVTHAGPMLGVIAGGVAGALAATLGLVIGRRGGS